MEVCVLLRVRFRQVSLYIQQVASLLVLWIIIVFHFPHCSLIMQILDSEHEPHRPCSLHLCKLESAFHNVDSRNLQLHFHKNKHRSLTCTRNLCLTWKLHLKYNYISIPGYRENCFIQPLENKGSYTIYHGVWSTLQYILVSKHSNLLPAQTSALFSQY